MKYLKNNKMDYIPLDNGEQVVFDPDNGNTHFIDKTGVDIICMLNDPKSLESIITELSSIYDADQAEIESDVKEFISDLFEKQIIIGV